MAHIIYLLTNTVNGKVYVGQTSFTLEKRWREHLRLAFSNKPRKQRLHWAIQKYGAEVFVKTTLATAATPEELDKLEEQYIRQFDSTDKAKGYNDSAGGGNGRLGVRISETTREKLRIAWIARKQRGDYYKFTAQDSAKGAQAAGDRNKILWEDPRYRQSQSKKIKDSWSDKRKKEQAERARQQMLWKWKDRKSD